MKNLFLLLTITLLCSGCSESDEKTKSETLGNDLANRIKSPIERTGEIIDKLHKTRATELPE